MRKPSFALLACLAAGAVTVSSQPVLLPGAPHTNRAEMAAQVRAEFEHSWNGYKTYAWGHDELLPVSNTARDWHDGAPLLMTPVDDLRAHCRTPSGYTSLKSVVTKEKTDRMHSFWLAETLKYLYLLAKPEAIDFEEVTFNTEAHPLRKVRVPPGL